MLDTKAIPNDVEALQRRVREQDREIEHLKLQLARLRRWKFGQSSESLHGVGQIALTFEQIDAALDITADAPAANSDVFSEAKQKPVRRQNFPEHFERIDNVIQPKECVCPDCGGQLKPLGKPDVAQVLETKTVTFTVTRHIRPKKRCSKCSTIVQAPAPSRPLERSFAGASILALILVWKYGFHVPLYRQCQILAHAGLKLSRTTLMQWVGGSAELLGPLVAALAKHVLQASKLNADDTPFKVLAPGTGKTKVGRLWTYVRDGTRYGAKDPPAVWYRYSPSWHGKYPQNHLATYKGKLQVDGYAGFEPLFVPSMPGEPASIEEISCWAHARRKFFDLYAATKSPAAQEAIDRIRVLYAIEAEIRGQSAEARLAARQQRAVPVLKQLHAWMIERRSRAENKSGLVQAFDYALNRWSALIRYTEDGTLEIDNNIAERSLRGAGLGRKNFLFFGSDSGGERAAIIYSVIQTCKLNHIDPQRYLQYVLERIADHPINRIEELLPWKVADKIGQPQQVTEALAA